MALTLSTIKNNILTSLFGRRLGLIPIGGNDYLGGPAAIQQQVLDITTTVPNTAVPPFGTVRVLTSGSSQGPVQHTLSNPVQGVSMFIGLQTTSTGSYQFLAPTGVSILATSDGTTKALINLIGQGGGVTLYGFSSGVYACESAWGSSATPNVSYTTST